MLDLSRVDLDELGSALEDNTPEHDWFLDTATGELIFRSAYYDYPDDSDLDERDWVRVDPIGSHEAYRDMEDFVERVGDRHPRELLERSIAGRGAFRRFKDTLFEFPELREAWFRFHDARMRRRAIDWLRYEGLIAEAEADRAIEQIIEPDPPGAAPGFDALELARAVAIDLRALYGERLTDVVLFGSHARGDADADSDIDLLVVLDGVASRSRELARMDPILFRHSLANDTVITEIPVSEAEFRESDAPLLARVRAEGVPVG